MVEVKCSVHSLQSWSELEIQDGEEVPPRCLEVDLMDKTETWSFTHTMISVAITQQQCTVVYCSVL